jgi:hypothetical protein
MSNEGKAISRWGAHVGAACEAVFALVAVWARWSVLMRTPGRWRRVGGHGDHAGVVDVAQEPGRLAVSGAVAPVDPGASGAARGDEAAVAGGDLLAGDKQQVVACVLAQAAWEDEVLGSVETMNSSLRARAARCQSSSSRSSASSPSQASLPSCRANAAITNPAAGSIQAQPTVA